KAPQVTTQDCYQQYYARKSADRNSLLSNPEVLFQSFAQDAAMVRALRWTKADPKMTRVLDVGCGEGGSLWLLQRLGFEPANLFGVDIQEQRIRMAKARNPVVTYECMDATRLAFDDEAFDLAMESTMFLQMTDDEIAGRIASEMLRVTKPEGLLLLSDWRNAKPGSKEFRAESKRRIADLYSVGTQTKVVKTFRGPLIPPIGRFFSKHLPSGYFIVQALFPVLVGHMITILRKI